MPDGLGRGPASALHLFSPDPVAPEIAHVTEAAEPWRHFRDSLAIRFVSKKRQSWSPETLPQRLQDQVLAGLGARDHIRRCYLKLRSELFDLTSGRSPASGATTANADTIRELEKFTRRFQLLAEGFVEVREDRNGSVSFHFELGREKTTLSQSALERSASDIEMGGTVH